MVQIRFSWCLLWFLSALVYFSSSVVLADQPLASEKYPRHDENWWFWNQEGKEKLATFEDTQKKGEKEIHKLEIKRSAHPFTPDIGILRSLFSKEGPTHHNVKKRWLSGGFGLCGKNKMHKESRKWLIDSQRSGANNLPTTPVIQDRWMPPQRIVKMYQRDHETDNPLRKSSARPGVNVHRKHKIYPEKFALQHNDKGNNRVMNVDNLLFRSSNHVYNKETNKDSFAYRHQKLSHFPEQRANTYGYLRSTLSSAYQRVWNKSRDPLWDRYMTPFGELKINPLKQPYPYHDSRSSIKWYTTPNYGLVKTSEPPLEDRLVQNDHRLSPAVVKENVDFDEIMESKGVAKSKGKKAKEIPEQVHGGYELIPKIYALNKIRNGKKSNNKYNDRYGWISESVTNPIIVPGFKHKNTEAPDDERLSLQPYIIRTEERKSPFDDDFIQVSRANRNQTKNVVGINENNKVAASGLPMHLQSPYAFPGGVNISILVPNPPAPSSHETPLSTVSSNDKNMKKKKERKKKVKNDELFEDLLSEPRSLASHVNLEQFPCAEKTGANPLIGNDDRKINGMQLISYIPQLNNSIGNVRHPIFDSKTDNFSIMSHIRNLTLNHLDWDTPLFGIQTEKVKKPSDYNEDDGDDDEIRMLYDERAPSTTTLQSDEKQQTVSFSWYRLTDFAPRTNSVQDSWGILKSSTPPNVERISGFGFGGSGRVTPRVENNEHLIVKHKPRNIDFTSAENGRTFRRSAADARNYDDANEAFQLKNYDRPPNNLTRKYHHGIGHMDQWDVLDEDLKSEISKTGRDVAWQARNRKRETDYSDRQSNDEQGYYRLSDGGNSLRNPTNLIMSAFRAKSKKHRDREYYDDTPEDKTREQMRPSDLLPSKNPE